MTFLETSQLKARVDKPYPFPNQLIKEYSPLLAAQGSCECVQLYMACALSAIRKDIPIPRSRKI